MAEAIHQVVVMVGLQLRPQMAFPLQVQPQLHGEQVPVNKRKFFG